jgi:flagellar biosynthesis/type III secretory pathway protein FliH
MIMEYSQEMIDSIKNASYKQGHDIGYSEGVLETYIKMQKDIIENLKKAKHQISLNNEALEIYRQAIDDAINIVGTASFKEISKKNEIYM